MRNRRREDAEEREIGSAGPAECPGALAQVLADGSVASGPGGARDASGRYLLRLTTEGREVVVVGSELVELCPGANEVEQVARAESIWRDRVRHRTRREALPGKLIAFFAELHRAETEMEVRECVSRHVLTIVGGYRSAVVVPDRTGAGVLDDGGAPQDPSGGGSIPDAIGIVHRQSVEEWFDVVPAEVRKRFTAEQIAYVAHLPFGADGALLLAERRAERVLEADEWEILEAIAEQGAIAMRRARTLAEARALALTDGLTGLANRRQFEIVMKHAWAAAERGEDLALLMLDIDDFKSVNDAHGHEAGDQVLRIVADVLRREARGGDAVVRWGGDEFLVLMPGGTSKDARALADRIRGALAGWVELSAGVVCHHPSLGSPAEMLRAADERLYLEKRSPPRLD